MMWSFFSQEDNKKEVSTDTERMLRVYKLDMDKLESKYKQLELKYTGLETSYNQISEYNKKILDELAESKAKLIETEKMEKRKTIIIEHSKSISRTNTKLEEESNQLLTEYLKNFQDLKDYHTNYCFVPLYQEEYKEFDQKLTALVNEDLNSILLQSNMYKLRTEIYKLLFYHGKEKYRDLQQFNEFHILEPYTKMEQEKQVFIKEIEELKAEIKELKRSNRDLKRENQELRVVNRLNESNKPTLFPI